MKTKELWLIRHAESLANSGAATSTPGDIPLSEKGFLQAKRLAEAINLQPDLIIVSPYLRSQQTAAPLINILPETPTEILTIQEFTYLSISRTRGTTHEQRKPLVEEFWKRGDPHFCDGEQAESLAEFFYRVENFLRQMSERAFELAFAFTHEQFIKALIWEVLQPAKVFDEKFMSDFQRFMNSFAVPNTAIMKLKIEENGEFYIGKIAVSYLENYA
jgi:2,3-bisphosphoglycerate-dependent phosphoglycerate mutase